MCCWKVTQVLTRDVHIDRSVRLTIIIAHNTLIISIILRRCISQLQNYDIPVYKEIVFMLRA